MGITTALRFKQWLPEWDQYEFDSNQLRRRPTPDIYLFSMPAVQLRSLSGVYRRRREGPEADGLQRFHDEKRSAVIRDFVNYGYPYGAIRPELRHPQYLSLRKPGWLPTAIVVNILTAHDARRGRRVANGELISVNQENDRVFTVQTPDPETGTRWVPTGLEPLEVIDGQHRLWAFDEAVADGILPGDFELPVVAFHGLDIGWQAYLFWSINVSPKRINPSHAFDLYPLLRSQDWLETQSELRIYREARAQELTELMYLHPESPWFQRINMLGGSGINVPATAGVTQAGWVRALTSTFLAPGGRGRAAKGLFAAPINNAPLDWPRSRQAALIMELWRGIRKNIVDSDPRWARGLRVRESGRTPERTAREDPFSGTRTMLNQEQGVRGVLATSNEILYSQAVDDSRMFDWELDINIGTTTSIDEVTFAINHVKPRKLKTYIEGLAKGLAEFDWRTMEAPNLSDHQRLTKRAYRGSGGYVALREQLLSHLAKRDDSVGERAAIVLEAKAA